MERRYAKRGHAGTAAGASVRMYLRWISLRAALLAVGAVCSGVPAPGAAADGARVDANAAALAGVMGGRRSTLLGEVHDNAVQHALRAAALRQRVEAGARPAIAFEQFDIDRQADIDRVRRERPGDAGALIEASGAGSWKWPLYQPFVQLALDYDLPIVAGNLSRSTAMRVFMGSWDAAFDADTQSRLGLAQLPAEFLRAHREAVARGHCDLLPEASLAPMARAQIARDITLARAIRPHLARGVVLLTGNGHVRNDIGVPFWLTADERREVVTVGLLEAGGGDAFAGSFDFVVETVAADRPDPCEELKQKMQAGGLKGAPAR